MKLTRKTITGTTNRYADWRKKLVALADGLGTPDAVRDQITEPMMKDAWGKNETPEYFLSKMMDYFS